MTFAKLDTICDVRNNLMNDQSTDKHNTECYSRKILTVNKMARWTLSVWIILHVHHALGDTYWKVDFCEATGSLTSEDTVLMLDCIQLCRDNVQCKLFTREGVNCTLYAQPSNDQCRQGAQLLPYFVQQDGCMNGGYLLADGRCMCVQGFVGINCTTRMTSCSEGHGSSNYINYDGVLPVHPASSDKPFFVHCDMVNGGRLYVQTHQDTNTDLYKSWEDMAEGFGTLIGDHWLGNRHLYDLVTSRGMDLTFSYVINNGTSFTRTYTNFKIDNEENNFSVISFTSTFGDLGGDCLSGLVGKSFSASDRDNDGLSWWSCANEHGGSWWFDACEVVHLHYLGTPALCNPNGPIRPTEDGIRENVPREIFWVDFPFAVYKTSIWLTDSTPP